MEDKPPFFTAHGGGKQFGDYDERHLCLCNILGCFGSAAGILDMMIDIEWGSFFFRTGHCRSAFFQCFQASKSQNAEQHIPVSAVHPSLAMHISLFCQKQNGRTYVKPKKQNGRTYVPVSGMGSVLLFFFCCEVYAVHLRLGAVKHFFSLRSLNSKEPCPSAGWALEAKR